MWLCPKASRFVTGQSSSDTEPKGFSFSLLPQFPPCWIWKELQAPPAQGKAPMGHFGHAQAAPNLLQLHIHAWNSTLALVKCGIRLKPSSSCTQMCQNPFHKHHQASPAPPTLSWAGIQPCRSPRTPQSSSVTLECPFQGLSSLPQPQHSPAQRISCTELPVSPLTCSGCSGSASAK